MEDRRRFVRWQTNYQAQIKLQGAEANIYCRIADISLKGLQISLGVKLEKDVFIKLSIALAANYVLDTEVWVAWHRTVGETNVYGLYFSRIKDSDKEKIYQFLRKYFPEIINRQWSKDVKGEKGDEKMEDRRIFARFPLSLNLRFLGVKDNQEGQGRTFDVSAKGIGFVTDRQLEPNAPLEMWLKIPDKGEPLYTRGEVVWSKPTGLNEYKAGVNLEKADLIGFSRLLRM